MVTLVCICKGNDGFILKNLTVRSLDMKEIIDKFRKTIGWGFDTTNFEIFQQGKGTWYCVAMHNGRGWTRIATNVKGWEKYASPSWVKKVKAALR